MSDELSPEAREMLNAAMAADEPSEQDRARVRKALMAAIGGGVVAGASAAAGGSATTGGVSAITGATAGGMSLAAKVVAAVLVIGAIGGGAVIVQQQLAGSAPETRRSIAAPAVMHTDPAANTATATDSDLRPRIRRPAQPAAEAIAAPAEEVAGPSQLQEETRLLREARAARQQGDVAAANAALDEHERRYPQGMLATERARIRSSLTQ